MLGRLLEEVASKTKARLLILDPNSDSGMDRTITHAAAEQPADVLVPLSSNERSSVSTMDATVSASPSSAKNQSR
jgi:hypothetical protein